MTDAALLLDLGRDAAPFAPPPARTTRPARLVAPLLSLALHAAVAAALLVVVAPRGAFGPADDADVIAIDLVEPSVAVPAADVTAADLPLGEDAARATRDLTPPEPPVFAPPPPEPAPVEPSAAAAPPVPVATSAQTDLATAPQALPLAEAPAPEPAAEAPIAVRSPDPAPARVETVEPRRPAEPARPTAKAATKEPVKTRHPPGAERDTAERGTTERAPAATTRAEAGSARDRAASAARPGGAGGAAGRPDGAADALAQYLAAVRSRIVGGRRAPVGSDRGRVEVRFAIAADGRLDGIRVAGFAEPALEEEAVRIVRRASPVPPIPAAIGRDSLAMSVTLEFK